MDKVTLLSPDGTRTKITGRDTAQRYLDLGFRFVESSGDLGGGDQGADPVPDSPATGETQDETIDETEEV